MPPSTNLGVGVAAIQPVISAVGAIRCGAGYVTLTASGAPTGGSYRWYTVATGGTAISGATGSSYTVYVGTPGTTNFYVSAVDASGANETSRASASAYVRYALPPSITANGSTTFGAGGSVALTARPNLALQLDGSTQYVTTTLDAQPSALPTTTWEAWVYPTRANYGVRQTLFSIDDGAYDRGVDIESNTYNFAVFTGQGVWQPVAVDLNVWQHIAVVYTPTSILFYKNGVEYVYNTSSASGFSQNATNNTFHIGHNPGFNEPFQGQMDEVRVWNYQRTQAQVQTGMFTIPAGSTTGLVGSWRFNEGSGNTVASETGSYPGTLMGSTPFVTPGQTSILASTYAWTPTTGLSSSTAQTVTASPAATTTYTVAVTDNNSCAVSASQTVTVTDLTVSTATTVPAGTYTSITVTGTGTAILGGNVTVNGPLLVQSGGSLNTGCNVISGSGSFTLQAGATLSICDAAGIMASGSTGAVQVAGTRSFSPDASYVYSGTAAQSTGTGLPSQVRNLTTTNSSNVTLTNPVQVNQIVTVGGSGDLVPNNQALTLPSGSTGSALIVNSGTGTITGYTTVVQRYIDPTFNPGLGYRHYATPMRGSGVIDLSTPTFLPDVTMASTYNSSATPGTTSPFPNVFAYDQSRLATVSSNYGNFDKGFVVPASLIAPLEIGRGYAVNLGASELVDFVGQPVTGDQNTLTLNRGTGATAADAGWALVGNPYPAPLDWSQVVSGDRTGLEGSIYLVQSTGQYVGQYRSYTNGMSTTVGNNPLIATGQGFFVRVAAGNTSGSLTFRNAQRVTTYASQATFNRTATDPRPQLHLSLQAASGAGLADGLALYAEAGALPNFDADFDSWKLPNSSGLNVSTVTPAGQQLAIDGRPAFTAGLTVPLAVGVPAAGTYRLRLEDLSNLPANLAVYVTDTQTGVTQAVAAGSSYPFSVTATEATALLVGRFSLRFSPLSALATAPQLTADLVTVYPNPAQGRFTVSLPGVSGATSVQAELLNGLGQVVLHRASALPAAGTTLEMTTANLAAGVYVLRLQAGSTSLVKRIVLN